ncbi:hypothetical protein [Aeromonas hydrophila]|uniref:hypothetical protein n=1 Tax=Aeromonas hydrophila TaxID=644 RepID=UPI001F61F103|nr:hypothetical protein [Aeromonas hydrophila]UNU27989.1 hypothetical protein GCK65_01925 [Aeromonas hydrophila]
MKNNNKYLRYAISFGLSIFPALALAEFSNMLWVPVSSIAPDISATPLSDGVYIFTLSLITPSGYIDSRVVASSCKPNGGVEKNDTSSWLMFPDSGTSEAGVNGN